METKTSLSRESFEKLKITFDLDHENFDIKESHYLMDELNKLKDPAAETSFAYTYLGRQKNDPLQYGLQLKVIGVRGVFKDVLSRQEADRLLDKGWLPDPKYSSIARQLVKMGIKGPFRPYGHMSLERARIYGEQYRDYKIYLDRMRFNGINNEEYGLRVYAQNGKTLSDSSIVLSELMAGISADIEPQKPKMQRLHEVIAAQKAEPSEKAVSEDL